MDAEGQVAQQGIRIRYSYEELFSYVKNDPFIEKKISHFYCVLARAKKNINSLSNQTTPQPEFRSTVRRSTGVTQSQRKLLHSFQFFSQS